MGQIKSVKPSSNKERDDGRTQQNTLPGHFRRQDAGGKGGSELKRRKSY